MARMKLPIVLANCQQLCIAPVSCQEELAATRKGDTLNATTPRIVSRTRFKYVLVTEHQIVICMCVVPEAALDSIGWTCGGGVDG